MSKGEGFGKGRAHFDIGLHAVGFFYRLWPHANILVNRINRRYIISSGAIKDMINLSGSKLKVVLTQSDDSDIYISRDRLSAFKGWLDR